MQMGVQRVYLDAAGEIAKSVWCAVGFTVITDAPYQVLANQFCLVLNDLNISARCLKLVPDKATLLAQVSCTQHKPTQCCLPCPTLCCNNIITAFHKYTSQQLRHVFTLDRQLQQ